MAEQWNIASFELVLHLFLLVIEVRLLYDTVKSIVDSSELDPFVNFLQQTHKLMSYHVVYPQAQQRHGLVAIS